MNGRRRKINNILKRPFVSDIEGMKHRLELRLIDGREMLVKVYPCATDWFREQEEKKGEKK